MPRPALASVVELLKPITWFPPMWAFGCGAVSSGQSVSGRWPTVVAGIALSGPLVCAASQAVNDWFDRHVDAINEPNRPIPSGRIPGRWGLIIAWVWTGLSLMLGAMLGKWVLLATIAGLLLAWAYSAPPLRFKQNGWIGNAAVAISYEGLAWVTGAAVMIAGTLPDARILLLAALYSAGAHGIMTLNDFKSVEGDKQMGVRSLPVSLGVKNAGLVACAFMALAQVAVILLLLTWGRPLHAGLVSLLLVVQLLLMRRLLESPRERAPWYGGTGVTLYVLGMLVSAFALRPATGNP
jgi:chlorophyll/bacteriochlorophyll a synthase